MKRLSTGQISSYLQATFRTAGHVAAVLYHQCSVNRDIHYR